MPTANNDIVRLAAINTSITLLREEYAVIAARLAARAPLVEDSLGGKLAKRHAGNASWAFCTGPATLAPLQRNRTCAYGNLLFVNGRFHMLGGTSHKDISVYLHNRYAAGLSTGLQAASLFSPQTAPPSMSAAGAKIMSAPLYIGGDLHGNVGHNMLDSVFPAFSALSRLRAAAQARTAWRFVAPMLPEITGADDAGARAAAGDSFTFLLYDQPPCCPSFHKKGGAEMKERTWAGTLSGSTVDLPELTARCTGAGCLFPIAFAGAGQVGLSLVDRDNIICGVREHRALWAYTRRVYARFGIPPRALASVSARTHLVVLLIESKRKVTNLAAVAQAVEELAAQRGAHVGGGKSALAKLGASVGGGGGKSTLTGGASIAMPPGAARSAHPAHSTWGGRRLAREWPLAGRRVSARVLKWEGLSFVEQLRTVSETAVQLAGVGTAQMNTFLLPEGAVAICLGWRNEHSRRHIEYFDSHLLRSLDHVRALYYPSYEPSELSGRCAPNGHDGCSVTLNLDKAAALVLNGLELAARGFAVPVAQHDNANVYDDAWRYINERSSDAALRARNEGFLPGGQTRCLQNGVAHILWGGKSGCAWDPYTADAVAKFAI